VEYNFVPPKLPHFTAALISHSERWEHISLILPFDDFRWLDRHFPLLCDLTFTPHDTFDTESPFMVVRNAPHLTGVVLGQFFDTSNVVLPWSQLTSIDIELLTVDGAADILRETTVLVNLRCNLGGGSGAVPIAIPPLLHLESLTLFSYDKFSSNYQQLLLDALSTPALQHLSISERDFAFKPISTITSLLSRSHCSLDSLHITNWDFDRGDYRAAFPSIEVIQVRHADYSADELHIGCRGRSVNS
jgi:hypothetical protein